MGRKRTELKGQRFGQLCVQQYSYTTKAGAFWWCSCTCGTGVLVQSSNLLNGRTKSCGCLNSVLASQRFFKHGHAISNSPEYRAWRGMFTRCENPNSKYHSYYGGRGILICGRWRLFSNFLDDMGLRPSPKHSLDRENNDGHYEPENCRWATKKEQVHNRRKFGAITKFTDAELLAEIERRHFLSIK